MSLHCPALISAIIAMTTLAASTSIAQIYNGATSETVGMEAIADEVEPGTVVVLSELHDSPNHHRNQRLFIDSLIARGLKVSVGMEFFSYIHQRQVSDYVSGKMDEELFLKAIGWGGISFDFYRPLVLAPLRADGRTVALNAPRELTTRIAKVGLDGLTAEEHSLLPPDLELGNDLYRERFAETMGGHVPEEALGRYFAAQSTWDETMAWRALNYMQSHRDQVLVIIVGDFHVRYGGGLPDRLRTRGHDNVLVISQTVSDGLTDKELWAEIAPHPRYGERGDYVWVSEWDCVSKCIK